MCKYCVEATKEIPDLLKCDNPYMKLKNPHRYKLYFIADEGTKFVKIGVAVNPQDRLEVFQTGNPLKLVLIAVYQIPNLSIENKLHKLFSEYRIRNSEWFEYSLSICGALKELWWFYHCGMTPDIAHYLFDDLSCFE